MQLQKIFAHASSRMTYAHHARLGRGHVVEPMDAVELENLEDMAWATRAARRAGEEGRGKLRDADPRTAQDRSPCRPKPLENRSPGVLDLGHLVNRFSPGVAWRFRLRRRGFFVPVRLGMRSCLPETSARCCVLSPALHERAQPRRPRPHLQGHAPAFKPENEA
jgi:hypothetical protein